MTPLGGAAPQDSANGGALLPHTSCSPGGRDSSRQPDRLRWKPTEEADGVAGGGEWWGVGAADVVVAVYVDISSFSEVQLLGMLFGEVAF